MSARRVTTRRQPLQPCDWDSLVGERMANNVTGARQALR
jgi:hypothetical protein